MRIYIVIDAKDFLPKGFYSNRPTFHNDKAVSYSSYEEFRAKHHDMPIMNEHDKDN